MIHNNVDVIFVVKTIISNGLDNTVLTKTQSDTVTTKTNMSRNMSSLPSANSLVTVISVIPPFLKVKVSGPKIAVTITDRT